MAIYTYHYTYLITNTIEEKHYIGSRSCNCLPTEDLGKKYFSSKSFEKETGFDFQKDQKENPQNYQYQILEDHFTTRTEATSEEILLHKYFDVGRNTRFYNKAKQTSVKFDTTGIKMPAGVVEKQRQRQLGVPRSEDFKKKVSAALKGRTQPKELCERWSKSRTGKKLGPRPRDFVEAQLQQKKSVANRYKFFHTDHGEFDGSIWELMSSFPDFEMKQNPLWNLLTRARQNNPTKYKGWVVLISQPL